MSGGESGARAGFAKQNKPMKATDAILPVFHEDFRFGVDASRRVMIPSKWRPEEKHKNVEFHVILWPIVEKEYLLVLPPDRWQVLLDKLKGSSLNNRSMAALEREIARNSAPVKLDSVWRLTLPEGLAAGADITDEALFVGRLNKFEIWNPKRAKAAAQAHTALVKEIAETIDL